MENAVTTVVNAETLQPILDAIQSQISIGNIIGIIGIVLGAGLGFVFMWWGVRKLISVIMKSALKGKATL